MSAYEERIRAAQQAEHDHAISFGVALPRVRKPKLGARAFPLGSCFDAVFSPTGSHLVVRTANGAFLWDVQTRQKLRLKTVTNPHYVVFRHDGAEVLMANEVRELARIAVPSGETVAKFRVRYDKRLDGQPSYTDDTGVIASQAYEGRLLLIDAVEGRVRHERAIWSGDVYGRSIHYQRSANTLWIVVSPTGENNERRLGSKLFRWRLPASEHEPELLAERWQELSFALTKDEQHAVLHYRVSVSEGEGEGEGGFRMEVRDVGKFAAHSAVACGGTALPHPSCSDDVRVAYASEAYALWEVDLVAGQAKKFAADIAHVDCAPGSDLIAVSGKHAHVLPRDELGRLAPMLADARDLSRLELRRYARVTTLPDRVLPPRVIASEVPGGFHLQAERPFQARYRPDGSFRVVVADPLALGTALDEMLGVAVAHELASTLGGAVERERGFLTGRIANPPSGATRCVIVSKAADLIELTAARGEVDGSFSYGLWPTGAIDPATNAADLGSATIAMLEGCTRARR